MPTALHVVPSVRPDRFDEATTIDEVIRNLDRVIDWSTSASSTIGYFAAAYKRATVAIRDAIDDGVFDHPNLIERLDVTFAQRYFTALNAYFYPAKNRPLTLAWEVTFVGQANSRPTIVQELIAGFNVHICFDLGVAVAQVAAESLDELERDFNRVNAILGSQVPGMLDAVQGVSPELRWMRRLIPDEIGLIRRILIKSRTAAWYFAIGMALNPDGASEKRVNQSAWTAVLGSWYLQPPMQLRLFPILVRAIGMRESRDVAANIRALAGISPEKLNDALM